MSSFSNAFETDIVNWIGGTPTTDPLAGITQYDVHLHVGDPGEAGTSATSPATYTGYAPITVDRNGTTFTASGANLTNDITFQFPVCSGGTNAITHASLTRQGDTAIIVKGALASTLNVANTIRPQIDPGSWSLTLD